VTAPIDTRPAAGPRAVAPRAARSSREAYGQALIELAGRDSRVWCVDSDTGGLAEGFGKICPGQYLDVGIAEATMMTAAAALAAAGKIPFVNTMAAFASTRACEQVKIDIAYNNLPVKIVGTHAGVSAGHLGPTHHCLEDLAIMRALPNMTVIVPADATAAAQAVTAAADIPGPVYIRLGRHATPPVHASDYSFVPGRIVQLRPGDDVTLAGCGPHPMLAVLAAAGQLADSGVSARVLEVSTIKPLDPGPLLAAAKQTRGIVTVEEHSIIGGLGGAVAELLSEAWPARVRRVGAADRFCEYVGPATTLLEHLGITARSVEDAARDLLA
jgi:transketolase